MMLGNAPVPLYVLLPVCLAVEKPCPGPEPPGGTVLNVRRPVVIRHGDEAEGFRGKDALRPQRLEGQRRCLQKLILKLFLELVGIIVRIKEGLFLIGELPADLIELTAGSVGIAPLIGNTPPALPDAPASGLSRPALPGPPQCSLPGKG